MSRTTGTIVAYYTLEGKFVKTYPSALSASRNDIFSNALSIAVLEAI